MNTMKKKLFIISSIVLTLGISGAFIFANTQAKNEEQPKQQSVVKSIEKPVENVQEPTEVQEPVVIEESIPPRAIVTEEAPVSPSESMLNEDVFGYTIKKLIIDLAGTPLELKVSPLAGAITSHYETKPELFTKDNIDSTINRCIANFQSLDQTAFFIALAKRDCGL